MQNLGLRADEAARTPAELDSPAEEAAEGDMTWCDRFIESLSPEEKTYVMDRLKSEPVDKADEMNLDDVGSMHEMDEETDEYD